MAALPAMLDFKRVDAESAHALLLHELQDMYDAEWQLVDALPQMEEQAFDPALKKAFREHLAETRTHITRLEQCFKELNEEPKRMTCDGMKGLIKEGQHVIAGTMDPLVKDDALIASAQKVEHYEMAAYGSAREHAQNLGYEAMVRLLNTTLQEEGKTDHLLSQIAKGMHKGMPTTASQRLGRSKQAKRRAL